MGGAVAFLELMPDGSAIALDDDGDELAVAATPWALDANGTKVPTHYEVGGNTLIQVIEHKDGNFEYGIVADPWWNPFSWPWGKWVKATGKVIKRAALRCLTGAAATTIGLGVGTGLANVMITKAGKMRKIYLKGGPYAYVSAAAAGCVINNIKK